MSNTLFDSLLTYDPQKIDLQHILTVCKRLPKDGHIDINIAEELSIVFLQCADDITDEIGRCAAYCGYCEADRRDVKSTAIDTRIQGDANNKAVAASVAVQLFGNDSAYKDSHRKQALAEAFLDWLRAKHRNLMAAHVLCKDILKIHYESLQKGGGRMSAHPHDIDNDRHGDNTESLTTSPSRVGAEKW